MDMTETMAKTSALDTFLYRLEEWRWPEAFSALLPDVMLVMDADVGAALLDKYGPFRCCVASPETYRDQMHVSVSKLVFLSCAGERRLVKQASQAFPKVQVFSATYDLAGVSIGGGGYFEWQHSKPNLAKKDPVLIIATPGSDAEYFAEMLRRNGVCNAREYLNRTAASLAAIQEDFSFVRFLAGINSKHGEDQLQMVLYTDVLQDLMVFAGLSFERLVWLIEASGTKVIYYSRRDKSSQVSLLAQLEAELGRSYWAPDHLAQPRIDDPLPTTQMLDAYLAETLRVEAALEPVLTKLTKFKYLTLEETIESPIEVMEAVAVYLGQPALSDPVWPEYAKPYRKRPNLQESSVAYRQLLIDRLGLKVNEYGSFISDAEFLQTK